MSSKDLKKSLKIKEKPRESRYLTSQEREEITVSLSLGEPISLLSKKYKVSEETIREVRTKSGSLQVLMTKKKEQWLATAWRKHTELLNVFYDFVIEKAKERKDLRNVALSFGILSDKLGMAMGEGKTHALGAIPMNVLVFDKGGEKVIAVTPDLKGLSDLTRKKGKPSSRIPLKSSVKDT